MARTQQLQGVGPQIHPDAWGRYKNRVNAMILPWHISAVSSNLWFSSFLNQRHPLAFDNPQRAFPSCPDLLNSPRFPWLVREGSPRHSNTNQQHLLLLVLNRPLENSTWCAASTRGEPPSNSSSHLPHSTPDFTALHSTPHPPSSFLPAHSPCLLRHFLQQLFNSFINVSAFSSSSLSHLREGH